MRHFAFALVLPLTALGCTLSGESSSGGGAGGATSSSSGGGAAMFPAAFDLKPFDAVRIGSNGDDPATFQHADATIDLGPGPFAKVTVAVDLATKCFPFENWKNDPPPAGENWPADCDAFDRNFELSIDDAVKKGDPPGIEVMRAITPFGGPEHQDLDITDVANALAPGKHRLKFVIPTYSDGAGMVSGSNGGWNVSAAIHVVPGPAPYKVLAMIPLFDGVQTSASAPAPIAFDVPPGAVGARIEYRVTGHGGATSDVGCIGPAEEFCKRTHEIRIDDDAIFAVAPWRDDCAALCTVAHYAGSNGGFDYCQENPCGDMNSVRAPRANWCPGSLTPPIVVQSPALLIAGRHTFSWAINDVVTGGDWRISAVYFALGE